MLARSSSNRKISTLVAQAVIAVLQLVISHAAAADQPNILFFLADDVGSEVLECYGGQSYRTPRLNQLAEEGLRFTHAYAMPACYATRTTLLSGQYWIQMGRPEWGTYPPEAENRTLAQVLKRAGYATAIAGKWQLALLGEDPLQPHRLGFDQYALFGWHEGPRYYQPHIRENGQLREDVSERYGPDVYCDTLIDFISTKRTQPFFALYSMALCHAVTNDLDHPVPVGPHGDYQSFGEMVVAMDERVGRIVDAVDALGLSDNTLIVFFSDNGSPRRNIVGAVGDELVYRPVVSQRDGVAVPGGKAQLTDAGTRVPLIVRWPGTVRSGATIDQLIDVSDFLPTLADLADAAIPKGIEISGLSFAPQLLGRKGTQRQWVYAEHKLAGYVKNHRWKLFEDGRFYDVKNDPGEEQALNLQSLSPEVLAEYHTLQQAIAAVRN